MRAISKRFSQPRIQTIRNHGPHSKFSGSAPRPKKLRPEKIRIALPKSRAAISMTGPMLFGRTSVNSVRLSEPPIVRAADIFKGGAFGIAFAGACPPRALTFCLLRRLFSFCGHWVVLGSSFSLRAPLMGRLAMGRDVLISLMAF